MHKFEDINADGKRRSVLVAALKCFSEIGLQKASINDICKISGMRSGHIYYYFKSKADILEAAFNLGLENLTERLEYILDNEDIVAAIIGLHQEAEMARREWNITPGLRLEFAAETVRNERLRKLSEQSDARALEAMLRAAERAIASGRLDPRFEPSMFARAMRLIWNGLSVLRVESNFDLVAYEETVAKLLGPWLRDPAERISTASPKALRK